MTTSHVATPRLALDLTHRPTSARAEDQIFALATRTRHHRAQQVIYREGDAGEAVYAVFSGHLKAECWGPNGRAMLVSVLGRGDIFGELSLLDDGPRGATVTVLNDAALGIIPRDVFLDLVTRSSSVTRHLLKLMSKRLRTLARRCEIRNSAELSERLARAILHLARKYGAKHGNLTQLPFRLSQQEIGNLIGASRESVNKALRCWAQTGMLSHEDGILTILDERALRELLQTPDADIATGELAIPRPSSSCRPLP